MVESIIGLLNLIPEFVSDAIIDSVKLIPALFVIFMLIEIFENYFAHKITSFVTFSKHTGPIWGAFLALIPQCGFSVVMTTLFIRGFITLGTLISVYIATSDEAIPVLLVYPSQINTVWKILLVKLVIAVLVGYLVDCFIKPECCQIENSDIIADKGCCEHEIVEDKMKNIFIHPIKHTFNIFLFILIVCLGLNYLFSAVSEDIISQIAQKSVLLQPVFFAIFGLIPNCAVSVIITMLYIKSAICFGAVIAGLTTNAGLGLLVLCSKKIYKKYVAQIIAILLFTGIIFGFAIQLLM